MSVPYGMHSLWFFLASLGHVKTSYTLGPESFQEHMNHWRRRRSVQLKFGTQNMCYWIPESRGFAMDVCKTTHLHCMLALYSTYIRGFCQVWQSSKYGHSDKLIQRQVINAVWHSFTAFGSSCAPGMSLMLQSLCFSVARWKCLVHCRESPSHCLAMSTDTVFIAILLRTDGATASTLSSHSRAVQPSRSSLGGLCCLSPCSPSMHLWKEWSISVRCTPGILGCCRHAARVIFSSI